MKKLISGILVTSLLAAVSTAYAGSGKGGKIICADFKTQAEAQAYFNAKKPGYKRLDRDKDGVACEALP